MERLRRAVLQPRGALDLRRQVFRRCEGVDVASASAEPAIELVAECGHIRHRDIERSVAANNAPHLPKRAVEIVEMLEAVIRDDEVDAAVRERQPGRIALHRQFSRVVKADFPIESRITRAAVAAAEKLLACRSPDREQRQWRANPAGSHAYGSARDFSRVHLPWATRLKSRCQKSRKAGSAFTALPAFY